MNYLNLHTSVINSKEVKGADPRERATWFMLLGHSVEMENSGRIIGCRAWKCRRWQQTAGVMLKEVNAKSDLWTWDGDDLLVKFYPIEQEFEVQQRRERARENGGKGGRPKKTNVGTHEEPTSVSEEKPTSEPTSESVKEGKERKGNGKEGKEIPPVVPQGDGAEASRHAETRDRCLPQNWRNIPRSDRKRIEVLKNTPLMERIGKWFNRKTTTLWTVAEGVALFEIKPKPEDVDLLESYYLAVIDADQNHRRKDLITLLNNWRGEVDRAEGWKAENP